MSLYANVLNWCVTQFTPCPFPVDELPACSADPTAPPPWMEGQEAEMFARDAWGKELGRARLRSFRGRNGLEWVNLGVSFTPLKKWSKVVPFPA